MPRNKSLLAEFRGLVTAPGLLARNPASCVVCDNFELDAPGVMRKRRGIQRVDAADVTDNAWKLFSSGLMGSNLLVHAGNASGGIAGDEFRYGDGSGTLSLVTPVDSGAMTRLRTNRARMAVCGQNHYLTVDEGVTRLESDVPATGSLRYAGMPRGMGLSDANFWGLVAGTSLANGYARAYRVTWHRKDASGVELGGAPSTRFVVSNRAFTAGHTGAARAADVRLQIPWEYGTAGTALTDTYYWRLWGTRTFDEANGQLGDDEMYLVTERYLTALEIAARRTAQYVDDTPDSFLLSSPTLHTNLSNFPPLSANLRQGIVNEDAPPPIADDVAYWQDCVWYGNLAWRPRVSVELLATGAPGLVAGDTVSVVGSVGTVTVTGVAGLAGANQFTVFAAGPTAAINIRETCRDLVRALNEAAVLASRAFTAHHISTTTTTPGAIYIEATKPGFVLQFNSSNTVPWRTFGGYVLGADAPTDAATNGLAYSKPLRADAVAPVNTGLTAGPATSRILALQPFRDILLVFTDGGIYQVTGRTFADFAVYPFDLGYRLLAREMVVMCDERIYAWCLEGVVEIDESGVRVVSEAIEPYIESAFVTAGNSDLEVGRQSVRDRGFAVAYRNRHQVRFFYPRQWYSSTPDALNGCNSWLAFDTRTRTWVTGAFPLVNDASGFYDNRSCAVVRFSDDRLYLGNWNAAGEHFLHRERLSYGAADWDDDDVAGDPSVIPSQATFQFQVPDDAGAVHWQQLVLSWEGGEVSWRPQPTSCKVLWETEADNSALTTFAVAELLTRCEPPSLVRRGNRMQVTLVHDTREYAGLVGLSVGYRAGSTFGRRVTP